MSSFPSKVGPPASVSPHPQGETEAGAVPRPLGRRSARTARDSSADPSRAAPAAPLGSKTHAGNITRVELKNPPLPPGSTAGRRSVRKEGRCAILTYVTK